MPLSHSDMVEPSGTVLICPNLGAIWGGGGTPGYFTLEKGLIPVREGWLGPSASLAEPCLRENSSPPTRMEPGPSSL
jgi:hypothetical protein